MAGGTGDIGIYGKVPAHADFVRWNAGAFSSAGLDRWLEEAVGTIVQRGARVPAEGCCFLLLPAGARDGFVGALAPSADAVGRTFPLVVFQRFSAQDVMSTYPAITVAARPFLGAAAALLATREGATAEALGAAAARLPQVPRATAPVDGVSAHPAAGTVAPTAYAFRTVTAAAEAVGRSGRAPRTPIVLDVEAASAEARGFWLELLRRQLRWADGAPSLLWTEARMLAALGPPQPSLLLELAAGRPSARVWPLTTAVAGADAEAQAALTPRQRELLGDGRATLGDLLAGFGGAA